MADATDLKSVALERTGSSPVLGTNFKTSKLRDCKRSLSIF